MTPQDIESLYIRSLDEPLSADEKESITSAIQSNTGLAATLWQYNRIREITLRKTPATFGPYFARKVVARIQNVGIQIDHQILAYFKKYQLVAVGVVMALFALNAMFADQLDLQTIFGVQDTTSVTDEIASFDFNELINK